MAGTVTSAGVFVPIGGSSRRLPATGETLRDWIERAHGRTSSYVVSGIGPAPFGRWQFSQLRWRIGAMSFV